MDNETKKQSPAGDALSDAETLRRELESLRGTFQQKYDETVKEAEEHPPIQELEYGEEFDPEDETVEITEEKDKAEKKSKNGKKKKRNPIKIALVAICVTLLTLIIAFLVTYVAISIANPNFNTYISEYVKGNAAEDYEDRVSHYEKAIECCADEDSEVQKAMRAMASEALVVAVYNEKGYLAAMTYADKYCSDEQLEKPVNKEFKDIVAISESFETLSDNVFAVVFKNVGNAQKLPEMSALTEGLSVPSVEIDTVNGIIEGIANAYIFARSAEDIADSYAATELFLTAYNNLVALGVDSGRLAQNITVVLYNNGFVIEACNFMSKTVSSEAESLSEEFTAVKTDIEKFASFDFDVAEIAGSLAQSANISEEKILSTVKKETKATGVHADTLAKITNYAIKAVRAENDRELDKAATYYATLDTIMFSLGIDSFSLNVRFINLLFEIGDINTAAYYISSYITDERLKNASDEDKAVIERIEDTVEAIDAVAEKISPFMTAVSYGNTVDFNEVSSTLTDLIEKTDSDYVKGFSYYYLYEFASYCKADADKLSYLKKAEEYMPEHIFVYANGFIATYLENNDFGNAKVFAEKVLAHNADHDLANSVLSIFLRVNGDLDGALEAALAGVTKSSGGVKCTIQTAVLYMLKGDYKTAFTYVKNAFAQQNKASYDLVIIFNACYDGKDEAISSELKTMVSTVEQAYAYSQLELYKDTEAIKNGEKTLEDVFLADDFDYVD